MSRSLTNPGRQRIHKLDNISTGICTGQIKAGTMIGEAEHSYISDLAVRICTDQINTGTSCRRERTAKYNQLLRIEEVIRS